MNKPLSSVDEKDGSRSILDRYMRFYGVLAETMEDAMTIVENAETDGVIVQFRGEEREFWQMSEQMQKMFPPEQTRGVFHKSGRMFFNEAIERGENES